MSNHLFLLPSVNNWFAVFTVWVALFIEFSGILHICYVVQMAVGKLAGKPIASNEPPKSTPKKIFFVVRCIWSFGLLCFSFAVTLTALFNGQTTMWGSVPPAASVVLFFVLLFIIGLLEASQIAYFAVAKLQKSERGDGIFARKSCDILFVNKNHNLGAFLIGRQLLVVSCMFIIARITSVRLQPGDENIFGVSDGIQGLFNTGLLGALIVAIIGSVTWRLLASAFPMFFLSNVLCYILLRFALLLEMTGLLHGAWVLAYIHKKIAGFQRDEVYIGTAEERAAKKLPDHSEVLHVGPGHIIPAVDPGENPLEEEDSGEVAGTEADDDEVLVMAEQA